MAIHYAGSPAGRPVSALVALKMDNGAVFWIGGECSEMTLTQMRDVEPVFSDLYGRYNYAHEREAEVTVRLHHYTGQWREGAPDVQAALNPGQPLLPSGDRAPADGGGG